MASRNREINFKDFMNAAEGYLGAFEGFRAAVILAIQNNDLRTDELEDELRRLEAEKK